MAATYHTTLYGNFFLLRVSICFSETPVTVERRGGGQILTWRPHSSSAPDVSLAVESCTTRLQECLHEHGGGKVGHIWFDGDVPLFHVNFHTRMALMKLVAGKSEVEKKLMTKLRRDWGSPGGVRCTVDTELYLVCPDYTKKKDHEVIPVNNKNKETCIEMWVESQLLELGSLLRGCRVEVPRPEVSMKLLLSDLTSVRRPYNLGIQLGVPESDLDDIEVDYRHSVADRRREALRKWLRIDEHPSWSKLIRALVAINERHVARNIAEKYGVPFPSELEPEKAQRKSVATTPIVKAESDEELRTKTKRFKPMIEKEDSKLAEIDKELDTLKMERRQNRKRTATAREEAEVVVEDVERLEQEKQLLLEEIRRKERELDCFKRVHDQLTESQREKEDLQESIKLKENELREVKAKLEEKKKQLEKYKEKIQKLKKRIEEGVRELGVRDGRITELEKDKAKAVAALESERIKSVERMETVRKEHAEKEDQLREGLAEKEDQLRKRLAEKDAHISSHLKEISDLQQQLKLAVDLNAQSLVQYKQLAELQEARIEREREKIAIESELMVVTQNREEHVEAIREVKKQKQHIGVKQGVKIDGGQSVIKVFLVNEESRHVRLNERMDIKDVVHSVLSRLRVNMEFAPQLFSILFRHGNSGESYWLQPGFTIAEQLQSYCSRKPLEEWKFMLRIHVFPRTPQHLLSQDPVAFQYFYDQVLNDYMVDDEIVLDNETAVKLGCLELRRFYKDMPQKALKKKENFTMLERDIGLEKFFKYSLLSSVKRKNLRAMVLQSFQQYENLTMEGCILQFFSLLSKHHAFDVDRFAGCAVGDDHTTRLTSEIFVGPNCNVEYCPEGGEKRFLAAFSDIRGISYETELMSRGRISMEIKTGQSPVVIRTATLVMAINLATLIDAYCMVYTPIAHSRMSGISRKSYSTSVGLYSTATEKDGTGKRAEPLVDPYSTSTATHTLRRGDDYDEVWDSDRQRLGRSLSPREVALEEEIGEGQFGAVHKGLLYPGAKEEVAVAIKTCNPDASREDRVKFLEEAAVMKKFDHPHIIKLIGVVYNKKQLYIIMELAPLGQLRRYLLMEGTRIPKLLLLQFIHQLSLAMVCLESNSYIHRDIAARNVLVTNPEVIKLSDFGMSRGLQDSNYYVASRGKLPIKWMAPESINFRRFSGLSDVWMFGVCCWEIMMRGVKPFVGIKNDEAITKIELGERLPLPAEAPAPLFSLMNRCWRYDPEERPDFRQVEATVAELLKEERHLAAITSHHLVPDIATQKPPYQPPSSKGFMQVKSHSSVSDDDSVQHRMSGNLDNTLLGPALPPRISTRFRELSPPPSRH